jgi:hypothetical protein
MPYKDPEKTAEAMRKYRERKAVKDKAKDKAVKEILRDSTLAAELKIEQLTKLLG